MKIHFKGFYAYDPPTATSQQKVCTGKRKYVPTPDLTIAQKFWSALAKQVFEKTGDRIAVMRKPLFYHMAFAKPLLKKHQDIDMAWNTQKPDCDNWNKLPQDCMVEAGVLQPDSWIARLVVEKMHCDIPGVSITIGTLDEDDLPYPEDLMFVPQFFS